MRSHRLASAFSGMLVACLGIGGCSTTSRDEPSDGGASDGTNDAARAPTRRYEVTIENVSGDAALSTAISPGVFAVHGAQWSLFTEGEHDRGEGLEHIAEDGNPAPLASVMTANTSLSSKGVFDTPVGDASKGAATPGKKFVFEVEASVGSSNLSFATMYGQSNDWVIAPAATGVPLFDANGTPLDGERDVSGEVYVWDVGSEVNQAPGQGPDQGPRQAGADTGPAEGVLAPYSDTTRAYPGAHAIARVTATADSDGFSITVTNVSGVESTIATGISPVFYAVHDASWKLFEEGAPASAGLEALAEDGNAAKLAEEHQGASGTLTVGVAAVPNGASAAGAAKPGNSYTFRVVPNAAHRWLSIATMVGESNDAWLGFPRSGVALLDESGAPRAAADVAADLEKQLIVWDAGTEANEVPGAGSHQGPRQSAPGDGAVDPTPTVRRYADATNDLAVGAGGVIEVTVSPGSDAAHLTVQVTNRSASTPFPGRASPVVWAVHTGNHAFFVPGKPSPAGVEHLAEDGNGTDWDSSLAGLEDVAAHGIVNTPTGSSSNGPIEPGAYYTFTIPVGGNAKYFDFAAMWTPSNDTFLSLGTKGVALVDAAGAVRPFAAINAEIATLLGAWDAGTEANQAGALGPDQAPRQAEQNTGADEGGGRVRKIDGRWGVPVARHLVRVKIRAL